LYLSDMAMVAADTTRTKIYLKSLIENRLMPSYLLLLLNNGDKLLPGQSNSASAEELIRLLNESGIKYEISSNSDINSHEVLMKISNRPESVFIFSGFGGVILNDDMLDTGKRFLHVHGGYLPDYKGSTTNYYSLMNENLMGASSLFLNKEIDCGAVLLRRKFPPPEDRSEIDHIYDSEIRSKVLIETIKSYVEFGLFKFQLKNNIGGETFYIVHPVIKHLAMMKGEK